MALLFRGLRRAEASLRRNVELNPERPRAVYRGLRSDIIVPPALTQSEGERQRTPGRLTGQSDKSMYRVQKFKTIGLLALGLGCDFRDSKRFLAVASVADMAYGGWCNHTNRR